MLEKLEKEDFDGIFEIMKESFPLDEYRTYDEQRELLDKKNYAVYGVRRGGRVAAFIALWENEEVTFIDHFAVRNGLRGNGLGGKVLKELLSVRGYKTVCLEVEPPENDTAKRRIAFYERCGFFLNVHPYTQPALSAGRNPVRLMIMTSRRAIDADEFIALKNTLYESFYRRSSNR